MFQPTDEITIKLTAQEWNVVLEVLGTGTFRMVSPIIGKMMQQSEAQMPKGQQGSFLPTAPSAPAPNGSAAAPFIPPATPE